MMAESLEFIDVEESLQERMTRLDERLASFTDWPEQDVNFIELAHAGFYFIVRTP